MSPAASRQYATPSQIDAFVRFMDLRRRWMWPSLASAFAVGFTLPVYLWQHQPPDWMDWARLAIFVAAITLRIRISNILWLADRRWRTAP